jgi:hypothetical protein
MATEKTNVYGKLASVQKELKAPKNQYNSFGKFSYRSCEDILEGVKPLLTKYKATLFISDTLELIGSRFYVKATATFTDIETGESVSSSAYARESENKKGLDDSQVTGSTSSYARKYALNGLLLIDDNKDADTDAYQEQQRNAPTEKKVPAKKETAPKAEDNFGMNPPEENVDTRMLVTKDNVMTKEQYEYLLEQIKRTDSMDDVVKYAKDPDLSKLSSSKCVALLTGLLKRPTKA